MAEALGADWRTAIDPGLAARLRRRLPLARILLLRCRAAAWAWSGWRTCTAVAIPRAGGCGHLGHRRHGARGGGQALRRHAGQRLDQSGRLRRASRRALDLFHSLRFELVVDAIEAFAAWVRSRQVRSDHDLRLWPMSRPNEVRSPRSGGSEEENQRTPRRRRQSTSMSRPASIG
jgi:hypothetical protein